MAVTDINNPEPLNSYRRRKGKTNRFGQSMVKDDRLNNYTAGDVMLLGSEKKVRFSWINNEDSKSNFFERLLSRNMLY